MRPSRSRAARGPRARRSTATTRSPGRSHAAGRCAEAFPLARRALRLGTKDPLLYFHRGYAEGCAGDRAAMRDWYRRALELEPGVLGSLGARRARGASER